MTYSPLDDLKKIWLDFVIVEADIFKAKTMY